MKFHRILILTFAYTLISCGGAEERKAAYMTKAKASIEIGDFDKARIELKNVLQIDPKNGEALYQLGNVYERQKDYRKAYANYIKAEELSPELLSNHAKLGHFYILMNDTDKAEGKVNLILSKESDNVDGLLLKSAVLLKKGKVKESINIVENIIKNNEKNSEAVMFLARLYLRDKKDTQAISLIDDALSSDQDNDVLNRLLVRVLIKNKMYDRAEPIYKRFLEKNPDSAVSYNDLAAFYNRTKNKEKAEKMFRSSIDNDPEDVGRKLTLVKYILAIKGNDEGLKELETFVSRNKGQGKLRLALAELYYLSGKKGLAKGIYVEAIKDFSEEITGIQSRSALALIHVDEKNFTEAEEVINEAISLSPNDPKVNLLRAKLALRDRNIEKAIIALRIVTKETPENIEAFLLLSKAFSFEGNSEQATNTLQIAYSENKLNPDGLLLLAKYYLKKDIHHAEKIINDYNEIKKQDYEGLSVKAAILNQNKMYDDAYALAEKLVKKFPSKENGYLQKIPYFSNNKNIKSAISVLEEGYMNSDDNRRLLLTLTSLQVSNKQFDIVEKRIKAELVEAPDDVALKTLLARVYVANKDNESAMKLLNKIIVTESEAEEPYLLLAQLYQNKQDVNSVKNTLEKGKKNATSSLKIPLRLATVYEVEGEYRAAINVYSELYKFKPDNLLVINNLASLLSDHGNAVTDLEFAQTLIQKLEKSDQPVFLDTVGWVYYKLENSKKAVQYLTQVIEKMPDVNVFNFHLGMAHKMSGNKVKAKTFLEKSLEDKKPFNERASAENALKKL